MRSMRFALLFAGVCGLTGLALVMAQEQGRPAADKAAKKPATKAADKAGGKRTAPEPDVETAIRASAQQFAAAYKKHDAKAIASGFTPDGEFIDEDGVRLKGREAIERHFQGVFEAFPDAVVTLKVESVQIVSPIVAIEEGLAESVADTSADLEASRYVALHIKQDGQWLIARSRDFPAESAAKAHGDHLRQLAWMVGGWVDEAEDSVIVTNCEWAEKKNFLLQEFSVQIQGKIGLSGTTRIGWDPLNKQIRSWTFDTEGGFAEGWWTRDGNSWIVKASGVTKSGEASSATNRYTLIDDTTMSWESRDRLIGGELQSDLGPVIIKRRPPAPGE